MQSRWLYLLLVLALLLPGARPRFAGAIVAGSAPLQGSTSSGTTTPFEEEEVHERTATSRQCQRIALSVNRSSGNRKISQFRRFSNAVTPFPSIAATRHNGFGGHITC